MLAYGGHDKLQILLDAWSSCDGDWRSSELYLKMVSRKTASTYGCRKWLTRQQIALKYDNNMGLADTICDGKLADAELMKTHTKFHPDAPGNEAGWAWGLYVPAHERAHTSKQKRHVMHGCQVQLLH